MLKKYIEFMKRSPLITAMICVVYVVICFKSVPTQTHFQFFIVRTMLCGAACFFLYQISGDNLEASFFGLALLILYWKTRNIWACGLAHGGYFDPALVRVVTDENGQITDIAKFEYAWDGVYYDREI